MKVPSFMGFAPMGVDRQADYTNLEVERQGSLAVGMVLRFLIKKKVRGRDTID
jgi:hypothetical protein